MTEAIVIAASFTALLFFWSAWNTPDRQRIRRLKAIRADLRAALQQGRNRK
jgi:hypothetical protein